MGRFRPGHIVRRWSDTAELLARNTKVLRRVGKVEHLAVVQMIDDASIFHCGLLCFFLRGAEIEVDSRPLAHYGRSSLGITLVARLFPGLDPLVPRIVPDQVLLRNLRGRLNRPLAHVPTAIDVDRLAGDVAVGGQHDHHVGHLVHGAEPSQRDQSRRGARLPTGRRRTSDRVLLRLSNAAGSARNWQAMSCSPNSSSFSTKIASQIVRHSRLIS